MGSFNLIPANIDLHVAQCICLSYRHNYMYTACTACDCTPFNAHYHMTAYKLAQLAFFFTWWLAKSTIAVLNASLLPPEPMTTGQRLRNCTSARLLKELVLRLKLPRPQTSDGEV